MIDHPPIDPQTAWQPYRPSAESPWDLRKAGHLYRRAAFGATSAELQEAVDGGPEWSVNRLLRGRQEPDGDLWATMAAATRNANNGQQLPALWLYRMLYSVHPLREKLTLFWHNHF